ncbi:MAG: PH domain-containing protein [Promethearchaeota archaeon]
MTSKEKAKEAARYVGRIDKVLAKKEAVKVTIGGFAVASIPVFFLTMVRFFGGYPVSEEILDLIYFGVVGLIVAAILVAVLVTYLYYRAYVDNFEFSVHDDHVRILHGVFTKVDVTIAFTRVQNINIARGVFDRHYGLSTVKIETAGTSGYDPSSGKLRPEGYIPGLSNAEKVVDVLKSAILRSSTVPGNLGDLEFTPQDVAFDNFVAYIINKMRDGDELRNNIRALRESRGLSVEDLAGQVGVRPDTVFQLERGKFNPSLALALKVGKALGATLEEIFSLDLEN